MAQVETKSVDDCEKLNTLKEVTITKSDLPLHCPMDATATWCSHPLVSLDIENTKNHEVLCPYCGTRYRLED